MDWNRITLNFGVVAPGSKQDYSFTYLGSKKIKSTTASCGCTSSILEGNKVSGVLTLPTDYSHATTDLTSTTKTVTAVFDDGTKQELSVACKVNRKFNLQ
jgi:hypothetical protein